MAAGTVRLHGYRETMRALNKIQRGAGKTVLEGLKEAGEPVRAEWVSRLQRYQGVSLGTIGPKVKTRGIVVQQSARKVTGRRGDFGSIEMRLGLAALFSKQDETVREVEKALDHLTDSAGF